MLQPRRELAHHFLEEVRPTTTSLGLPVPRALLDELTVVPRRIRLTYLRPAAPEVLATARRPTLGAYTYGGRQLLLAATPQPFGPPPWGSSPVSLERCPEVAVAGVGDVGWPDSVWPQAE